MSVSATSSRAVRNLAHRVTIDWSRPVWTCSPEVAAGYNKLRSWVAMSDSMAEKYAAPPSPVDFSKAKSTVRDKELVETLESFYKSSTPAPETFAMTAEEKEADDEQLAFVTEMDTLQKELLPILEKEIEFCESARTTVDTTITDMQLNYPLIHEEIEDELERREWFKDTGIGAAGAK